MTFLLPTLMKPLFRIHRPHSPDVLHVPRTPTAYIGMDGKTLKAH
ncbi:hypothetical protein O9992_26940 [Vibrio lentus]|nr:hypothetical protein [Vibrio lentus]